MAIHGSLLSEHGFPCQAWNFILQAGRQQWAHGSSCLQQGSKQAGAGQSPA
jgi:hypothetical protein